MLPPPPPTVTLVTPSNNAISQLPSTLLRWNTANNAATYRVQVSTDSTFAGTKVVDDSTVVDTFKTISGLQSLVKYYWRVNAKNVIGTSSYSSTWNFTTSPQIVSSVGANGTIAPLGAVNVTYNGSQSFTITPNTGYHIDSLFVDGNAVTVASSYPFSNVTANHTISAKFGINTYSLTVTAPTNGTISPSGTFSVNYGSNQQFTVTPSTGYHIDSVLVDGGYVGNTSPYTLSNITAAHTIAARFKINTYTLAATLTGNGTIAPSGNVVVNYGANQTFTITPNAQNVIDSVIVDGGYAGTVTSYTFTNVTAAHTIRVVFRADAYNITATAGANGSIAPSGNVPVSHGANQSFTVTPNTGYHIDSVIVDGAYNGTSSNYTFTNVSAAHTIRTVFKINTYNIIASAGVNGSIAPSGTVVANYGSNQQFTITPNTNYHIDSVIADGNYIGTQASCTFSNVTANHTVRAVFKINSYNIVSSAGSNGTIAPLGTVSLVAGSNQSYTLTPNTNYHVDSIIADGSFAGTSTNYSFTNIMAAHTIRAVFKINSYTISASAGANGSIAPSGSVSVNYGSNQSFTMTPNAHYHIDSVFVDGLFTGTNGTYSFTNVTAVHSISVRFAINTFTITASAGSFGSLVPSGAFSVDYGVNQQFTATPNTGYHIDSIVVDGAYAGNTSPYTLPGVSADHTIRAVFKINSYIITAIPGTNGSILPSGNVTVNHGSSKTFTISPNENYHIDSIIVDGFYVGNTSPYTFTNISFAHTVRTVYKINSYLITSTAGANGSIEPSGAVTVNYGTNQAFTITPAANYHIDSIVIDGVYYDTVSHYTFQNIFRAHTIAAYFGFTDTTKFRTFRMADVAEKPLKLNKTGKPAIKPGAGNWRDTAIARYGGKTGLTLGVLQTDKALIAQLGWIRFKKGADMLKFYSTLQTDSLYNAPFDSVRKIGSLKKKKFVKELAANATTYTNPLAQSFGVFKLNIASSFAKVTPDSFYALTYVKSGSMWNGYTLYAMMKKIDSVLTYYKTNKLPNDDFATVASPKLEELRKTLNTINDAFYSTISLANGDSIVKNQGLKYSGKIPVSTVPFLKRIAGTKITFEQENIPPSFEPDGVELQQNYPNPFNPVTVIRYSLLLNSTVTLKVYNVLGQNVATILNNQTIEAGESQTSFDASGLSTGIYFYRLTAVDENGRVSSVTKHMMLLK